MTAVTVETEPELLLGSPMALFQTKERFVLSYPVRNFDVYANGEFLMATRAERHPVIEKLVVVQNWNLELERGAVPVEGASSARGKLSR